MTQIRINFNEVLEISQSDEKGKKERRGMEREWKREMTVISINFHIVYFILEKI